MARIFEPSGKDELTPELDADIITLTHEEAIGCLRSLVCGAWVSAEAMKLAMRVQRRALAERNDAG